MAVERGLSTGPRVGLKWLGRVFKDMMDLRKF